MPEKAFAEIARQLDEVASEQETSDHEVRLTLLRHMLLLILEADQALNGEQAVPPSVKDAS